MGLFRTALAYLLLLSGICVSNNARTQTTITLGAGSLVSSGPSPINLNAPGLRGQFLYTASEILAAGGVPGDSIIALGFDVVSAPLQPLQNYTIHLKHTTNTDVSTFDYGTSGPLQTVLTLPSYLPNTSGFDMLTLDSAFFWNGTDNLLVEVCYYTPSGFGQGGDLRYDNVPNRFTYQTGSTDLCPLSTLTNLSVNGVLPQLQLTFATAASQPSIAVTPDSLALNTLTCDDVIDTSLLISNTGTAPLS